MNVAGEQVINSADSDRFESLQFRLTVFGIPYVSRAMGLGEASHCL